MEKDERSILQTRKKTDLGLPSEQLMVVKVDQYFFFFIFLVWEFELRALHG
jgi:hypothetical protein